MKIIRREKLEHIVQAYSPINLKPMLRAFFTISVHCSPMSLCVPRPIFGRDACGISPREHVICVSASLINFFRCGQIPLLIYVQKGQEDEDDNEDEISAVEVKVEPSPTYTLVELNSEVIVQLPLVCDPPLPCSGLWPRQ